jgi:hypothetical protein
VMLTSPPLIVLRTKRQSRVGVGDYIGLRGSGGVGGRLGLICILCKPTI